MLADGSCAKHPKGARLLHAVLYLTSRLSAHVHNNRGGFCRALPLTLKHHPRVTQLQAFAKFSL